LRVYPINLKGGSWIVKPAMSFILSFITRRVLFNLCGLRLILDDSALPAHVTYASEPMGKIKERILLILPPFKNPNFRISPTYLEIKHPGRIRGVVL
jgi:hypothetical protein